MGGTYVDRARANPGGGPMIGILFLVVALALVGTVGWGVVGGGFDPPSGQTGKHGTTATRGERGRVVAAGTP